MTQSLLIALLLTVGFAAALAATIHILLAKEDVRAAIGWLGFVWVLPFLGALTYLLFGVNRVRRRAVRERRRSELSPPPEIRQIAEGLPLQALAPDMPERFSGHARLVGRITDAPLTAGNAIEPLINGDDAYPAMLEAIETAERSVAFCTYIFDWDVVGRRFADALAAAIDRGVQVRVLLDAMGSMFIVRKLRRIGIPATAFNRPSLRHAALLNLRSHRKIVIADGRVGFTGGMNVRDLHQASGEVGLQSQDMMFRIDGPVVGQLMDAFAADWLFAAGETLEGEPWFPEVPKWQTASGGAVARAIADGPDERVPKTSWILQSALASARHSVRIVTPYFIPDSGLIGALGQAALRGVEVDILLPEKNNVSTVGWASQALWAEVLERGCRIILTPPPLDHSKLVVIDDLWTLIGSSNWDTRSLRLNFELNLETYDAAAAERLRALIDAKAAAGRPVGLAAVQGWPLPVRLRNRLFWLASPYF